MHYVLAAESAASAPVVRLGALVVLGFVAWLFFRRF